MRVFESGKKGKREETPRHALGNLLRKWKNWREKILVAVRR